MLVLVHVTLGAGSAQILGAFRVFISDNYSRDKKGLILTGKPGLPPNMNESHYFFVCFFQNKMLPCYENHYFLEPSRVWHSEKSNEGICIFAGLGVRAVSVLVVHP